MLHVLIEESSARYAALSRCLVGGSSFARSPSAEGFHLGRLAVLNLSDADGSATAFGPNCAPFHVSLSLPKFPSAVLASATLFPSAVLAGFGGWPAANSASNAADEAKVDRSRNRRTGVFGAINWALAIVDPLGAVFTRTAARQHTGQSSTIRSKLSPTGKTERDAISG